MKGNKNSRTLVAALVSLIVISFVFWGCGSPTARSTEIQAASVVTQDQDSAAQTESVEVPAAEEAVSPTPTPTAVPPTPTPIPTPTAELPHSYGEKLPYYREAPCGDMIHVDANSGIIDTIDLRGTQEERILGLSAVDIVPSVYDNGVVQPVFSSRGLPRGFKTWRRYFYCDKSGTGSANLCQFVLLQINGDRKGVNILEIKRMVIFSPDLSSFDIRRGCRQ